MDLLNNPVIKFDVSETMAHVPLSSLNKRRLDELRVRRQSLKCVEAESHALMKTALLKWQVEATLTVTCAVGSRGPHRRDKH